MILNGKKGFILLLTIVSVVTLFTFATLLVKIYVSMKAGVQRGENLVLAEQASIAGIEDAVYQLKKNAAWKQGFDRTALPGNGATYSMTFDGTQKSAPYSTNNLANTSPVSGWNGTSVLAHGAHLVSTGKYGQATCTSEAIIVLASDLFFDNFPSNGTYPDTWSDYLGKNFRVTNGVFYVGNPSNNTDEHRCFAGSKDWNTYSVNLKVTLRSKKGTGNLGYGIYFRTAAADPLDTYVFQYDPGYCASQGGSFLIRAVKQGLEQEPIAVVTRDSTGFSGPAGWWFNTERRVRIDVADNHFTVSIDDIRVLDATDIQNLFPAGRIGFRLWGSGNAEITEVKVTGGGGATIQYKARY
ncbi:MAG: hypothetical protein RDV48_19900 [Candidatus Eremiobacteraeota bacterium]|nr:hypothetical protein [Candidatus Eremiobacteraeota bacterium]